MVEDNKIYCENCLETMRSMEDKSIDLVVTSPPYGYGKSALRAYKKNAGENWNEEMFESVAKELYRVVKDGGVVVWVVGDATINGSESGTSFKQALFFKECGFNLYDTMIWEKTTRLPTEGRYYNAFEYMFVFSKGKPKALNFICDHKNTSVGGKRKKDKIINKGKHEFTETTGIIVTPEFSRRCNIWRIHGGKNPETGGHPAVFPEALVRDHIITWSNEGDVVYDPFMGSGTTAKMAHLLKRKWIGSEISEEYCENCRKRMEKYETEDSLFQDSLFETIEG